MPKQTVTRQRPEGIRRIERAVGYAAVSVVGLGFVCVIITIVAALAFDVKDHTTGIWPTITFLPILAFPIGILLIIAYLVTSVVRRSRDNKEASR
ncbi:hypothetical protein [Frondihabitans cladoniiphilus]|uniref:hypothetical protein n=1 Tax=Frondihabitans cladoniiphilus TaxID=715785 RepID=UPI0031E913EA